MEMYLEYIVKRKKSTRDHLYIAGIILLTGVFILYLFPELTVPLPMLASFWFPASAGAVYGAYRWIGRFNIEYEYILTNGELDVDRIISRRSRKRLLNINCRQFERVAPCRENDKSGGTVHENLDYSISPADQTTYFATYMKSGKRTRLLFNPSPKMLEQFKMFLPGKVDIRVSNN